MSILLPQNGVSVSTVQVTGVLAMVPSGQSLQPGISYFSHWALALLHWYLVQGLKSSMFSHGRPQVGVSVGEFVGDVVGELVGGTVGGVVGTFVGEAVGGAVGGAVGSEVGSKVSPLLCRLRLPKRDLPSSLRWEKDNIHSIGGALGTAQATKRSSATNADTARASSFLALVSSRFLTIVMRESSLA